MFVYTEDVCIYRILDTLNRVPVKISMWFDGKFLTSEKVTSRKILLANQFNAFW